MTDKPLYATESDLLNAILDKAKEWKKSDSEILENIVRECISQEQMKYIDTKKILRLSVKRYGNKIVAILKDFKSDENDYFAHIQHK